MYMALINGSQVQNKEKDLYPLLKTLEDHS